MKFNDILPVHCTVLWSKIVYLVQVHKQEPHPPIGRPD